MRWHHKDESDRFDRLHAAIMEAFKAGLDHIVFEGWRYRIDLNDTKSEFTWSSDFENAEPPVSDTPEHDEIPVDEIPVDEVPEDHTEPPVSVPPDTGDEEPCA
jgi:hypothetical protein